MSYCRDELGIFEIVSETVFDDLLVDWVDYKINNKLIKSKGGMYSTAIYNNNTGELIIKRHYRNDYMRAHCMSKLMEEAESILKANN